jgi:hypothetical protein
MTRAEAIAFIVKMVLNPSWLKSEPMFRKAQELAQEFDISANELLSAARKARNENKY